ncbi:MAG: PEP-CTERM sorting domain-containing protein [Cyanobacteriota bacterium]|nr:PEP-CTERM sorting domain-containing protein [Cyanobacteriota bacterium]
MLTLSKKLAAGIAATTAVAAVALAAPQAQAAQINFSFNGLRSGTAAATTLTTVGPAVAENAAEQPLVTSLLPGGDVFVLNFPNGFPGAFPNTRPVNLVSPITLGGVPVAVLNNPQATFRSGGAQTFSTIQFDLGAFSVGGKDFTGGALIFNSNTPTTFGGTGFVTPIPEPMTMLGASAAVAFGAAFKRRQAKKG